ncbi:hypothetical protein Poli38472_005783 [Pythium oligandrum]|uniref:Serine carboxypeptidase n=1 Tax=Pythium oligandrum TaxID=41045 RepID=A0A8K1CTB9_PYTOL|nr:hypothetical protein Poli38472_005783 [Pythium oligandrum]|eukprot:TMW68315.1 hypothetical protein Poli38472_005783 [Pythium oligandrum]
MRKRKRQKPDQVELAPTCLKFEQCRSKNAPSSGDAKASTPKHNDAKKALDLTFIDSVPEDLHPYHIEMEPSTLFYKSFFRSYVQQKQNNAPNVGKSSEFAQARSTVELRLMQRYAHESVTQPQGRSGSAMVQEEPVERIPADSSDSHFVHALPDLPTQRNDSLCGEQLRRETGALNSLYYVFYESAVASHSSTDQPPVILWLSGGPGCSGLVAALFELGPCTFDDETNTLTKNPYAWTEVAHVIFVDQPRGTGFSTASPFTDEGPWTEHQAMVNLSKFVELFFQRHPELDQHDFYIFGESFGGHYVPDLGAYMIQTAPGVWAHRLKGVGIGNGVVSPTAYLQTYLKFGSAVRYGADVLGVFKNQLQEAQKPALDAIAKCKEKKEQTGGQLRGTEDNKSQSEYKAACHDAACKLSGFYGDAVSGVLAAGLNMYDSRRKCHREDWTGLCYRLSRLETLVNQPHALDYFGVGGQKWQLCNPNVNMELQDVDVLEESQENVALLLDNGVRVLVYAGDADSMAPWEMQERWTHDMQWKGQQEFIHNSTDAFQVDGSAVGTIQTAHGLSLVRVFEAGHMVPHDQPKTALELVRIFLQRKQHDVFT